jgi:uncharacterized protein (TIGR03118 family)
MIRPRARRLALVLAAAIVALLAAVPLQAAPDNAYTVTPLVSDVPEAAPVTDPNLVNAWGLTASSTSPWWVANNETGTSTLYNGNTGQPVPLVVSVPGDPTGAVFNGGSGFQIVSGFPARFIFAGEDGTISGWNPGASAVTALPAPAETDIGANYKGLAIAGSLLYAADFHNRHVDVFDTSWHLVDQFTDPSVPANYAPFGIQTIGSRIYVTFARQDAEGADEVAGPGFGFVDAFDREGNLVAHVAQHGFLNAPWGLAMAPPTGFGRFSGDLLVGNFGDGRITAYQVWPTGLYTPHGQLRDTGGNLVEIGGLWALEFGNGAAAGPTNTLFFTAGPDDEEHGLFGRINAPD